MLKCSDHEVTSVDTLTSWLTGWLAREFKLDPQDIDSSQAFLSIGMDSLQAMIMVGDLEKELKLKLPPTLVWDYPVIGELAEHLAERLDVSIPTARTESGTALVSGPQGTNDEFESPRPVDVSGNLLTRLLRTFKS